MATCSEVSQVPEMAPVAYELSYLPVGRARVPRSQKAPDRLTGSRRRRLSGIGAFREVATPRLE